MSASKKVKHNSTSTHATKGFYKLSRAERQQYLINTGLLSRKEINILNKKSVLKPEIADHLIENVIGCFQLPLGVAVNFVIDGKEYVIPMAIEETSVIAAASKTAKWIRDNGTISTETLGQLAIGQIQIPKVKNFPVLKKIIFEKKSELITMANDIAIKNLAARGGGVKDIQIRKLPRGDGSDMAVIHVLINTCDAMGANIINQVCEFLKPQIEKLTNENVGMCILSNLNDTKLTRATVIIKNIDPDLGNAIAEGSLFAQIDPYRAATNNKGVTNAIDGVLIATGNDWRAVEAGIHAYAARSGQYTSITRWIMQGNDLHGVLEAPIVVGIVGGVTKLHPIAQLCLKILKVNSAEELSRIIAAVGLVQNLAAIRALMTEGITKGHMKLHLTNLAMAAGATHKELPILKHELTKHLEKFNRISQSNVKEVLNRLRKK